MTSDALEEWHRYCLPAFGDRMGAKLKSHCEDDHVAWPGRSRHNQHTCDRDTSDRNDLYASDIHALADRSPAPRPPTVAPRLGLVDLETGEIKSELTNPDDSPDPEG